MGEIERDIIKNSEYIISYFKDHNKELTNLELQKLLYFLEAIYMVSENKNYLYKENFSAWNFGPVNSEIYKKYKNFGNLPIEIESNIKINNNNLKYIISLYELFKDFSATELVNLSHAVGSPWYKIYKRYDGDIPRNEIINKIDTKKWFKNLVNVKKENE